METMTDRIAHLAGGLSWYVVAPGVRAALGADDELRPLRATEDRGVSPASLARWCDQHSLSDEYVLTEDAATGAPVIYLFPAAYAELSEEG